MNDETQDEAPVSGSHGDVIFLLKRLQEQLTFLERKVDALLAQGKEKERECPAPAYDQERSYSKPPFRPSYNSERPAGGARREGRPSYGSKPSYGGKPAGRPSYGPKPYGSPSGGSGFAGKKKPFFGKRRPEGRA